MLLGALIYLGTTVLPEIIEGQVYIQQLLFYRGSVDLPVSFILAFLLPWTVASLVHHANTILSFACFFAMTVSIMVCYANPFVFICETVAEACHFETNFRLSLKQMYDGDRLSKKETSFLPKASGRSDSSFFDQQSQMASTVDKTTMLAKALLDDPRNANTPGAIKCNQYPTTRLLKQSKQIMYDGNKKYHLQNRYRDDNRKASTSEFGGIFTY